MKPLILINFKIYPEAVAEKGLKLVQELEKVKTKKYEIALAPSLLSLGEIKTTLPLFAQHADGIDVGPHTGSIPVRELKLRGIHGTILNHSEHKIAFSILKKTIRLCQKEKIITVVCASTLAKVKKIAALHPDFIAYEPSALIGGNISVTTAKPEIIKQAVNAVKKVSPKTKVLCGAGVHGRKDLLQALKVGTSGVLLAHAVVLAKNPRKFLEEMLG